MNQIVPGGMSAVRHTWRNDENYHNQDTFLTIEQEPSEASYYFWAQQFWFENGDGGYLGIQTGGQLNGKETKIAIFSIWQALNSERSPLENSWGGSFGNEGTGFSCKIQFDWKAGIKYRLRLLKIDSPSISNWWAAYINQELIGQIQTPESWGGLTYQDNFFVEYFLSVENCDNIPFARAKLDNPTRNFGKELPMEPPEFETYGECQSRGAVSYNADGSIIIETGNVMFQ